jgi:hypothetical protein
MGGASRAVSKQVEDLGILGPLGLQGSDGIGLKADFGFASTSGRNMGSMPEFICSLIMRARCQLQRLHQRRHARSGHHPSACVDAALRSRKFTAPATVPEDRVRPFVEALLAMSSQDPEARTFMELEGVQRWLPAQVSGYAQLEESVRRFQFYGQAAAAARD